MPTALLAARVALAAVFALASLTKLADLAGSRRAIAGFGVPEGLADPLGLLLPIAELIVAIALLPARTAWAGAIAATLLLGLFVVAIGHSLARGASPDCHCFGKLHSEPVGWRTLARNGMLAALAVFVAVAGSAHAGPSATAWIARLSGAGAIALGGALALVALAGAGGAGWFALLRQNGRLLLRIDQLEARLDASGTPAAVPSPGPNHPGLPVGGNAPAFTLNGLYGETVTLSSLTSTERPLMLLFTDPRCGPCTALMPRIAEWQHDHADELTLAVLTRGSAQDNRAKLREHRIANVCLDTELAVYEAYQANGTPSAVLIDGQRRIASPIVAGPGPIEELVAAALDPGAAGLLPVVQVPGPLAPPSPQTPPVGADAPRLSLSGLAGEPLELIDADRDTLVLFWNPACGFCQAMLDELRAFEHEPPVDAPRLLLISTGSLQDNEALGLRSAIALDRSFAAGRAFGTTGTPSGILVDRQGKVASELALGAAGVLALTGGRQQPDPEQFLDRPRSPVEN